MFQSRFLWKLYAGYAVIIVVVVVLIGSLSARNVARDQEGLIRQSLEASATLLRDIAIPHVSTSVDSTFQRRVWLLGSRTGMRLTVIRGDGEVIADSHEDPVTMDNHRMRPEVLEALSGGRGTATRYSETVRVDMMYLALPVEMNGEVTGFVRASLPLTYVKERLRRVRQLTVLGGGVAIVLALLIGYIFARHTTRPLSDMTAAAGAVAAGDYNRIVEVDRSDEIGQLARALNTMTNRLRENIEAITADRNRTQAILAGMVEGVIAVDREECIVHANSSAEAILGIRMPDALGRRIWEATRIREASDALTAAMGEQQMNIAEARIPSPEKEQVIQLIATPLLAADGGADGAILVLHDVSELRQLEAVRRDFIANVSHELKTPLAAIQGLVETLIDDPDMDTETHRRFVGKIRDQSERLSNLVVDLLAISRLESDGGGLQFAPIDLREPLTESFRSLVSVAESKHIEIVAHVPEDAVKIEGDEEALREMVDNLIGNAVKYTPESGRIEIRLGTEGPHAVLEVEDSGIGIDPEHQGRIFERFYRVDRARSRQLGGTGLGLSIVKHVALSHGGNVSLRSEPGRGSTFRVQIPLSVAPPSA